MGLRNGLRECLSVVTPSDGSYRFSSLQRQSSANNSKAQVPSDQWAQGDCEGGWRTASGWTWSR